jgi:acyl-CoA thioester hydrolase
MIQHTSEIRVRYADTDQMKNVYYGKYFEYFEQGRSDFLRALGLPYGELEAQGFLLPVIEAFARYKRPARYDDLLRIETRLSEVPSARIRLEYTVLREGEADVLVEGFTEHTFVSASTGRPTRAPIQFLKVINDAFSDVKA